ncbi:inner membrane-spanning protein YciB [Acinetobacter shaoyimingii]|uniref:Inner membrane-spanning protein YciB n=1 Tax=Acinetobacter shaoyimingii TaxID=2715164 RepID=A0A6G8RY92_9GAMM|nr:septation protein IspZ [Acinetobacter shaoyimingii]NHB58789.1 septation protein A [Acinetobacter shaoyimingii]QIO06916.1 septation protein A [Acinetobacter shaoyimingii]
MKALFDYLPIIIFFYFYKTTDPKNNHHPLLELIGSSGNTDQNHILVATCALLISTLVVYGCLFFAQKFRLEKMQWFIVIMSLIFGGITLIFSDVTYIKLKAVILNVGIGLGFLITPYFNKERLPIIQKMLGSMLDLSPKGWIRLNWAWCGQFFLLAALHYFFGFLYMQGKYWGEFTAFGDIIVSLTYLAVILFCLRKHFKSAEE